jgi:hypothetical protein
MAIDPPNSVPTPKWARQLIKAANDRNRARRSKRVFSLSDLISVWKECGGRCAVSGLAFDLRVVGDGQAKRPFAPSLDRIDRHQPYVRDNLRLVVSIANFAMNAWGLEPLLELAAAVHMKQGDPTRRHAGGETDAALDEVAATDADRIDTNKGVVSFPPRADLYEPIVRIIGARGQRSSREIEQKLAERFRITPAQRAAKQLSGCPAWRNHVAWTLVDLQADHAIEKVGQTKAPGGGTTTLYRLVARANR